MKHLFTSHYCRWLKKYCEANKSTKSAKQAELLIQDLPKIKSIDSLLELLNRHIPSESQSRPIDKQPSYEPIAFYCQLLDWRRELLERQEKHKQALKTLSQLRCNPPPNPVIELLLEILKYPSADLSREITPLLNYICNPEFQDFLEFIAELREAPKPKNPDHGTFAATKPANEIHERCLALLNNVSKAYHEHSNNPHWDQANGLLQTALLIYPSCKPFVEFDLYGDDNSDELIPNDKNRRCNIL